MCTPDLDLSRTNVMPTPWEEHPAASVDLKSRRTSRLPCRLLGQPQRQDRARSSAHDLVGDTAHHESRDAAAAVGRHHDEIDVPLSSHVVQYFLSWGPCAIDEDGAVPGLLLRRQQHLELFARFLLYLVKELLRKRIELR